MIKAHLPEIGTMENGWSVMRENAGVYGADYLQRATIALAGLGCNKPIDAVYPLAITDSRGKTPTGDQHYVMHFDQGKLPPAEAFWSITMYDDEGFQVANSLNRFAIGDRDHLKFNDDGSLDIYIQAESPGKDKESNWLPSPPQGTLGLTMRLYAPDRSVLDGSWQPPRVDAGRRQSNPCQTGRRTARASVMVRKVPRAVRLQRCGRGNCDRTTGDRPARRELWPTSDRVAVRPGSRVSCRPRHQTCVALRWPSSVPTNIGWQLRFRDRV